MMRVEDGTKCAVQLNLFPDFCYVLFSNGFAAQRLGDVPGEAKKSLHSVFKVG